MNEKTLFTMMVTVGQITNTCLYLCIYIYIYIYIYVYDGGYIHLIEIHTLVILSLHFKRISIIYYIHYEMNFYKKISVYWIIINT